MLNVMELLLFFSAAFALFLAYHAVTLLGRAIGAQNSELVMRSTLLVTVATIYLLIFGLILL
jgi:hypothetical protein